MTFFSTIGLPICTKCKYPRIHHSTVRRQNPREYRPRPVFPPIKTNQSPGLSFSLSASCPPHQPIVPYNGFPGSVVQIELRVHWGFRTGYRNPPHRRARLLKIRPDVNNLSASFRKGNSAGPKQNTFGIQDLASHLSPFQRVGMTPQYRSPRRRKLNPDGFCAFPL